MACIMASNYSMYINVLTIQCKDDQARSLVHSNIQINSHLLFCLCNINYSAYFSDFLCSRSDFAVYSACVTRELLRSSHSELPLIWPNLSWSVLRFVAILLG